MSRRFSICLVAFITIIAVSWTPEHLWAGGGKPARPFHGTAEGAITGFVPPNEFVVEAAGTATHLGRFTREEHLFLAPDGIFFTGTILFTSASGDELCVWFDGHFTSPATAVGTYEFVGGSGRFHDATGTATFEATLDDQGNVTVAFDGSIRY